MIARFSILILLLPLTLKAGPVSILIIPFENATMNKNYDVLETGIPELLNVCFSSYPNSIAVVDRSAIDAVLEEQSLSWSRYINENSIQSVGKLIGADFLLRGSLVSSGRDVRIQALLFNAATTGLTRTIEGVVSMNSLAKEVCDKIASPLAASLRDTGAAAAVLPEEQQPERQQLLITGLDRYYNNDYAGAFSAFLELIKQNPDDATANFWLARSFHGAGLAGLARVQYQEFISRFPDSPKIRLAEKFLNELELNSSGKE